jgi:hypothetical protein
MYEGFSGQARKAIQLAYEEARRRRHDYVGTEHVLLGVLREGAAGPRCWRRPASRPRRSTAPSSPPCRRATPR